MVLVIVLSVVPSLYEVHALGALDAVGVVDEVRDGGRLEDLGERGEVVGRAGREAGRRRKHAQNVVLLKRQREGEKHPGCWNSVFGSELVITKAQ